MTASRLVLRTVPPAALASLVIAAYWRFTGLYFQGGDTWPHIWTTRLDSPGGLLRVLSEPIMSGTVFPETVALFFRPLSSLSYAVNYALWGMNPFAFHLTDVLIHAAAAVSLYALIANLGARPWAAAIGAAMFALHPVMTAVVPSLPRRHDSLAGLGVVAALAIGAWLVRSPNARPFAPWLVLAAVSLGLGELAKESAYLGLALAVPTLVVAALLATCRWRSRLGRMALVLAAFSAVSVVLFAWRFLVLGGIGGYYERMPPLANLDVALSDLLNNLLFPWQGLLGRTPRAWLTEIGLLTLFSIVPMLLFGRRTAAIIAYGWVWLVVCSVFQMLTKSLAAWHTYITVAGFALLVSGVLDGSVQALATQPRRLWAKAVAVASLLGVLIFQAGIVSSSVLMRPYDEWRIAGEIGREYLASLRPCLERVPPGARVEVANAPDSIATTTPDRVLIHAGILGPYSVGPAVRLVMPDVAPPDIYAHPLTQLSGMPSGVSSRCMLEDGAWLIRTEYLP